MQTTRAEIMTATRVVVEVARAICDTWKETRLPVPQGPIYMALKERNAIQGLEGFQSILRLLAKSGFYCTQETIEPGPVLQEALTVRA